MNPIVRRAQRLALAARARAVAITLACGCMLVGPLAARVNALPSEGPQYTAADLGTLGGLYSFARGINNHGQVVGSSTHPSPSSPGHAFLYDSAGMHDLGTLGGTSSEAVAINDAGQIVGSSGTAWDLSHPHAFLYDTSGMHDLGPSGPSRPAPDFTGQSYATAINGAGQVVGTAIFAHPLSPVALSGAFLWQNGGTMQPLNASADANDTSWAFAINASGQVLGQVSNETTRVPHAFIWQNGVTHELVPPDGQSFVSALNSALNDRGQVIGTLGTFGSGHAHAALYDDTGWHDLGTLGGAWSEATAINNRGQIVGYSMVDASSPSHPFLYTGGVMMDLETLLPSPAPWDRFVPYGINDQGQIVGDGMWHEGADDYTVHAFLLTPTPAPSLSLSATALDFSGQPAGAAQQVTLTNTGDAPLNVQGLDLTGADAGSFHIADTKGAATLAPGASQTVAVTFNPATIASRSRRARIAAARTAATGYSATLEIHDNDPHPGAPHRVTLSAVGAGPARNATPPAAPTNLAATVTPANQVALTWTANSDNETAFAIWRQTGTGAFVRVGVVAPKTTHFTDAGVSPNTAYTYEVRAINNGGASAWSNPVTAVTPEAPPAAPTKLTAAMVSAGEIDLAWTRGGGDETGIAIFRRTGTGGWQRIGVVAPSATRYADRSVQPGTRYAYQVRAHNSHYVSAWSNAVSGITPAAP